MLYIFVGNDEKSIDLAFPNRDNFFDKQTLKICSKEDLIKNKAVLQEVKYIFGTWNMICLNQDEIETFLPKLEAIFYAAGSIHYFAKPFLEKNIRIFSGWRANAIAVAEFTLGQILLANKGYFKVVNKYKNNGYQQAFEFGEKYKGNYKLTSIGILGAGSIGKYLIKLLSSFDMEIKVFDPFMTQNDAKKLGVIKTDIENIFETCDIVSNHLALNEETEGLIDYSLLSKMKDYSTFINTARGSIVDFDSLIKVFKSNDKLLALLDVTDPYEPIEIGSEIFNIDNIIISPHRAGACTTEIERIGQMMIDSYLSLKSGKKDLNEITMEELIKLA